MPTPTLRGPGMTWDQVRWINGDLVPHEDEQKAISQMRRLRAKGTSLRAISQAMQAKRFSISHEGVARVLRAGET
jgi:uncharacterized protein YoaH (UPF0181 family)